MTNHLNQALRNSPSPIVLTYLLSQNSPGLDDLSLSGLHQEPVTDDYISINLYLEPTYDYISFGHFKTARHG